MQVNVIVECMGQNIVVNQNKTHIFSRVNANILSVEIPIKPVLDQDKKRLDLQV